MSCSEVQSESELCNEIHEFDFEGMSFFLSFYKLDIFLQKLKVTSA